MFVPRGGYRGLSLPSNRALTGSRNREQPRRTEKREKQDKGDPLGRYRRDKVDCSVKEALARCRATQTRDAIRAADLALKLVVVGQLLVCVRLLVSGYSPTE